MAVGEPPPWGLTTAAVNKLHHLHTIARAAEILVEEETVAFTELSIETLTGIIEIYKADPHQFKRSTDPVDHAAAPNA